jgi:hypothetical protein
MSLSLDKYERTTAFKPSEREMGGPSWLRKMSIREF